MDAGARAGGGVIDARAGATGGGGFAAAAGAAAVGSGGCAAAAAGFGGVGDLASVPVGNVPILPFSEWTNLPIRFGTPPKAPKHRFEELSMKRPRELPVAFPPSMSFEQGDGSKNGTFRRSSLFSWAAPVQFSADIAPMEIAPPDERGGGNRDGVADRRGADRRGADRGGADGGGAGGGGTDGGGCEMIWYQASQVLQGYAMPMGAHG